MTNININDLDKINFTSCLSEKGISDICAKSLGPNKYVVNEGKALRTHAKLVSWPILRFARTRHINTDFLLLPGTEFSIHKETICSNSVYPEKMVYADDRWHDFFYKPIPTNGISHLPNQNGYDPDYIYDPYTDFYLNMLEEPNLRTQYNTNVDKYEFMGKCPPCASNHLN